MKALYDTQTQKVLPYPRADGEAVVGLAGHLVVVDLVTEPLPEFDARTHKLVATESVDLNESTVTRGWNIVALTFAEAQAANPRASLNMGTVTPKLELTNLQFSNP